MAWSSGKMPTSRVRRSSSPIRSTGFVEWILARCSRGKVVQAGTFAAAADRVPPVTTDEPTALTDAPASLEVTFPRPQQTAVVVDLVSSHRRGRETFGILARACGRFPGASPELAGPIRRDARVPEAIRARKPLLARRPLPPAAGDIRALAGWLAEDRRGRGR